MFVELVNQRSAGGTRIFAAAAITLLVALRAPTTAASASPAVERLLSSARELHAADKLEEARALYERALPHLSAPGHETALYEACSELSAIDTALGNYAEAVSRAEQAVKLAERLQDSPGQAKALNRAGSARLYEGRYDAALDFFRRALRIDRSLGDAEGQVLRLNNIGNVHFFEGRYANALESYREARAILDSSTGQPWHSHWSYATAVNTATLWQRLGQHEKALDVYLSLKNSAGILSPREYARLLGNLGAVYRHLGDPVKALDSYREARHYFAREKDLDGELGVLKNIGIALALDLKDYPAALGAFDEVIAIAGQAGNRREMMQARLYRGEALSRLGRWSQAGGEFREVLRSAEAMGTVEEQWKALYGMGRVAERLGRLGPARERYEQSLNLIESLRGGLEIPSLKSLFLADKRDVYDALIRVRLESAQGADALPAGIFRWIERARARMLQDQLVRDSKFVPGPPVGTGWTETPELQSVQAAIDDSTALLVFWVTEDAGAVLWITREAAGLHSVPWSSKLEEQVRSLATGLSRGPSFDPRQLAGEIGGSLLAGVPVLSDPRISNIGIVPDGATYLVPFEALPVGGAVLVKRFNVFYLPSTAVLLQPSSTGPLFPWHTTLVALANPADAGDGLGALPFSEQEANAISQRIPGHARLRVGADARKRELLGGNLRGVPLVHLAAHAVIAEDNVERSRILMAPEENSARADYLFLAEVPHLDLAGVSLVTVSACETERGRFVRGEGVENFSRAFLLAGADATVTTLWKVADEPTAAFMDQFYYFLSRGFSKAEALRRAKLKFLESGTELAHPYYWAAFVVNGDGRREVRLPYPWSWWLAGAAILVFIAFAAVLRRRY